MTALGHSVGLAKAVSSIDRRASGAEVLDAAKDRILDTLAMLYAGCDHPATEAALESIADDGGPCTIIGRGDSASASDAAFVNAVSSHTALQEDFGGGGHPGTFVVPTALAAGERLRRSGNEVLRAIVIGYEIGDRLQTAVPQEMHARGFRMVPTVGAIAAAGTAAALLRLRIEPMASAFDIAANMAGGLYQGFVEGTMEGYLHAGFAARSGVFAARLAEAGIETSMYTLEGDYGFFRTFGGVDGNPEPLLMPCHGELAIERARSKPFPACALNQDTMLMVRALRPAGLSFADVSEIRLVRPGGGINGVDAPGVLGEPPYRNMLQAQMSAKFTAVATLLSRPVETVAYFRDSFADPEVAALCGRTTWVRHEGDSPGLELELRNGERLVMSVNDVPDMRWAEDGVRERFAQIASAQLGDRVREVRDAVLRLDKTADVRELMQLLKGR